MEVTKMQCTKATLPARHAASQSGMSLLAAMMSVAISTLVILGSPRR